MTEYNQKSWWTPEIYMKNTDKRIARMCIIKEIRRFFDSESFMEVDTPAVQICPGMEVHLKAFETHLDSPLSDDSKNRYLHTSPELTMKK